MTARRSFALEWDTEIGPLFEQYCASCHGVGQSAEQLTGLLLDGSGDTYDLLTTNQYTGSNGVVNASTKPGDGLTDLDAPGTDRITPRKQCCTSSRWLSLNSARSSMIMWALYGERLDGRDSTTGLPPSGVPVDTINKEFPEIWPKVAEHAAYVANMPEADKRLIARWVDLGAAKVNVHDDMTRPVVTLTPILEDETVTSVMVGLWDDSPLDYDRFEVTDDGQPITPSIEGEPSVITIDLDPPVTADNAADRELVFEIWDAPDRTWSLVQPGVPAANRTRRTVTGTGLLAMASLPVPPGTGGGGGSAGGGGAGGGGDAPDGTDSAEADDGCGCRFPSGNDEGGAPLVWLALLGLASRRRARR